jgi:VCBS repeat-containing protein
MATRRDRWSIMRLQKHRTKRKGGLESPTSRQLNLEQLEDRRLLAVGSPQLAGIRVEGGEPLDLDGVTRFDTAPQSISLRFDGSQQFSSDPDFLNQAIRITRAGSDGLFDTDDDERIIPGYIAPSAAPNENEILIRFAETLPNDLYRVEIFSSDDLSSGIQALRNLDGEVLEPRNEEQDRESIIFDLDLGAQIVSVVPQPIHRDSGSGQLIQHEDQIVVYFNRDPMAPSSTEVPSFYRVIDTTDGSISFPSSVSYDPESFAATLHFAEAFPQGTFELQVGVSEESNETIDSATNLGTLWRHASPATPAAAPMPTDEADVSFVAYIGDNLSGLPENDVDLYRFELQVGGMITADVVPHGDLDVAVRLFDENGQQLELANAAGSGGVERIEFNAGGAGVYFIGVSSSGNTGYSATTGSGATGGTSTGSYRLNMAFGTELAINNANTSFDTATVVGTLGLGGQVIRSEILSPAYPILLPGGGGPLEPGHRNVPVESHLHGGPSTTASNSVVTAFYNFNDFYGTLPSGDAPVNAITEAQKERAREIFQIFSYYLGIEFIETQSSLGITVATGDLRTVDPNIVMGPGAVAGISDGSLNGVVVMDAAEEWGDSEYGGSWFRVAMHEIGHSIGLGHSYDLPNVTIMGGFGQGEPVFPGDHDLVHARFIYPNASRDIDTYRFELDEAGWLTAETVAERLPQSSLLNSQLMLYREVQGASGPVRELLARNDDYFGNDSQIHVYLEPGTYYVAVMSTKHEDVDLEIEDSGFGGTTEGAYELHLNFLPNPASSLVDSRGTSLDGDLDGTPGGKFQFWFQAGPTIFVDRANDRTPGIDGDGSLADPFDNIASAIELARTTLVMPRLGGDALSNGETFRLVDGVGQQATFEFLSSGGPSGSNLPVSFSAGDSPADLAQAVADAINGASLNVTAMVVDGMVRLQGASIIDSSGSPTLLRSSNLVRIVGNGGPDGDISTVADNRPYLIGFDNNNQPLRDGTSLQVPQGVTVMIDAGALLKLRRANVDVGTSAQNLNRRAGALQVLGTPEANVIFASLRNDALGGDSDGPSVGPRPGDWGGIVFRADSDHEPDGIFLNWVNQSQIRSAGGLVPVGSVDERFSSIHLVESRPSILFNSIVTSADSAVSADPNSFYDEDGRLGPMIRGNEILNNSINGLFIRIQTPLGAALNRIELPTRWANTDIVHVVTENVLIASQPGGPLLNSSTGMREARPDGRLRIDPGVIVKVEGSRFEGLIGSQLIAEGTPQRPIIFTSLSDTAYGAGGTFRTKQDPQGTTPAPGDWGGMIFNATSTASLDHVVLAYAGGLVPIEGGFARFNALEVHQAELRLTNSTIRDHASGQETANPNRNGRGSNAAAVLFVRGAQPIVVNNVFRDNAGSVIHINANAMQEVPKQDPGRSTGWVQAFDEFNDNHGPLVRLNRLDNNSINGMEIRGGVLTTESVWDDTDIAHVLRGEITLLNHHTYSGLRLQSSPDASLVVKLSGANAGFTANGTPLDIDDRIGGSIYIVGAPGRPVIMTSLADDTVTAGFDLRGQPQGDTNNNGLSVGQPGQWRSIRLDEYSNDRNVAIVLEKERPYTGTTDPNGTPGTAQFLGELAPNEKSGDVNRRLGFEIHGHISYDRPSDVDVYSFTGTPGTEVWFDIDRTSPSLDTVLELLDQNGNVVARSTSNNDLSGLALPLIKDTWRGPDFYTINPRDAGMRVILPGNSGQTQTYYVRVRSMPAPGDINNLQGGLTSGQYLLQVRLRQVVEKPGSTIRNADIRYATNGIEVIGLPKHSPLSAESRETSGPNNTFAEAQPLGNLLTSDRNTISVGGSLSSATDVDWYSFTLDYDLIQAVGGRSDGFRTWATIFDIDYADGLARPDTVLSVFDADGNLILVSRDSNIEDDRSGPSGGLTDLSRGSAGPLDPFIGTVQMPAGIIPAGVTRQYYVAISSNAQLPQAMNATFTANPENPLIRLEPINSVRRIAEDHIGFQGHTTGTAAASSTLTPVTPLFNISSAVNLSAHVTPFELSDVVLYVSQGNRLVTVNPFSGGQVTDVGQLSAPGTNTVRDIAIRTDGLMFGVETIANAANTAGRLVQIDPGNAAETVIGNDNIPDFDPDADPIDPNQVTSDVVEALAYQRTGVATYNLFYAVAGGQNSAAGSTLFQANMDGSAILNLPVDEDNPVPPREIFQNVPGDLGRTTGMAFIGGTLFGVSNNGYFFTINTATGRASNVVNVGPNFSGLALGPQNVQGGAYANLLFAVTTGGQLYALNTSGVPQPIFQNGTTSIQTVGAATGLAFSPLDFNLWHPTMRRGDDPGHGINPTFDNSRTVDFNRTINGRSTSEQSGGASFYFGLEQWVDDPTNAYFTYGPNAQYGILSAARHQDLTSTAEIGNNYNLPGGALGSLTTNSFSLAGYSAADNPTLYFNYFLETQNANAATNQAMRDSARVFVSPDGGDTWALVATNNSVLSTPGQAAELPQFLSTSVTVSNHPRQRVQELFDNTGSWRQARIDLSEFAGASDLILRFDFSTAGSMGQGIFGDQFGNFNNAERGQNNQFEGFYIDDIIVGFTERGEMVTGTAGNTAFAPVPTPVNAPSQSLVGPYQLEIRRGTEYGVNIDGTGAQIAILQQFDTNDRLIPELGRLGDRNLHRDQGQVLIESNTISFVSQYGVRIDAGARGADGSLTSPGSPINGPTLNTQRLVPGVHVENNIVANFGQGGVLFSGDAVGGTAPLATVPFGRIVNNTIYGGTSPSGVGIQVTENASPTILNNILANSAVGIQIDGSSASSVVGANLFQGNTSNGTLGDNAIQVPASEALFVNASVGNFYLAQGARAIDSSLNSLVDRPSFVNVKSALGIPPTPILAPDRDRYGQFRVDDPTQSPPPGLGANIFKDRGAVERADESGPTASMFTPRNNDAGGLDLDPSNTVVYRTDGMFEWFEIRLEDVGVGVDATTVVADAITVTQDGRLLQSGSDYTVSYSETSGLIRIIPLNGIGQTNSVYVITLNNTDRSVLIAPSGDQVQDGDRFELTDENGVEVVFEYDSGYTLEIPQTLTLQVPAQGGASGGVTDGSTFRVTHQGTTVTFEFDNNQALVNANHFRVTFATTDSSDAVAHAIADALRRAGLGLSPKVLPGGRVHVGGTEDIVVETMTSQLDLSGNASAVVDGQTFTIDHPEFGLQTFEFDLQLSDPVAAGHIPVPYRLSDTQDDIARILGQVIQATNIDLTPQVVGSGLLHVGGREHVLLVSGTNLLVSGTPGVTSNLRLQVPEQGGGAGGISDGQTFTITDGNVTRVFEFDDDGETTSGNIIISMNPGISISSQDQLSFLIVQALLGSDLGLQAEYLGDGVVSIGGQARHLVDVGNSSLGLSGIPGGAVPIRFVPHSSFTGRDMGVAILGGINSSTLTDVHAVMRAGNTLFVEGLLEGAASIENIDHFTVGAIKDLAGNDLLPNLNSGETRFNVLIGEARFDFGDAPDGSIAPIGEFGYPTVFADNGARHVLYANHQGIHLGRRVDADRDGRPSIGADGDDLAGDGLVIDISQSPALSVTSNLTPAEILVPETLFLQVTEFGSFELNDGETFSISDGMQTVVFELDSNNSLTDDLHIRIPFSPGSTSEQVAEAIITAIQGTSLGLAPVDLGLGRVHLGSRSNHSVDTSGVPGITSGGVAGSVSDGDTFSITRNSETYTFEFDEDFATTPGNVPIFIEPQLTHEQIAMRIATAILGTDLGIAPLHLGNGVVELDGNDEDGVIFTDPFNSFIDTPITVYASAAGLLDAWIDANQDGDFDDPGEKVLSSVALAAGKNVVIVRAPVGAVIGETFMRFRFSELGGLDPYGLAASGEVEDYVIEIRAGLPPVAVDDPAVVGQFATDEDTPIDVTTSVLDNDFDPDPDDVLTVLNHGTFLSQRGAEVTLNEDGTFSYDPTVSEELQRLAEGVIVLDTFTYQAFDGFLTSNVATVTIRVTGVNDVPFVVPLELAAVEDGPVISANFIGDDIDDDDNTNTLIYTIVDTTSEGLVTNLNNGTFTFDPLPDVDFQDLALDETRDVFFTYTATDRHGAVSDPATVTITVTGVNDAPTAEDMFVSITEDDSAMTWTLAADDIDSDDDTASLSYTFQDIPQLGTFVYNGDGTFTFDPEEDFQDLAVGDMPEFFIRYQATDRHGATSPEATITLQVIGLNDTPTVEPLELDAVEDGPALTLLFPGDDIDNDDDQSTLLYTILEFPEEGLLTNNEDGTFTFDVLPGEAFQDLALDETRVVFFVYNATDRHGAVSESATVTITVTGVNDAPTVEDMLVTVIEDGDSVTETFAADDIDSDDDTTTLTYVFGELPPGGVFTNNEDGTFTFDPGEDFQELAQDEVFDFPLVYQAVDQHGAMSPEATITIRVIGVNDTPIVQPLELAAVEDGEAITELFAGDDIDSDDDQSTLVYTIVEFPEEGLLTNNDDGTFTFDVLPGEAFQDLALDETRVVFFVYTATDQHGAVSDPATVTITVTGVNDAPTIEDMLITVFEDGPAVTATLAADDIDSDDDTSTLTYIFENIPTLGTATYNGDGTVTYDPGEEFQELAQDEELDLLVTYQAIDRHGAESPVATITIRVIGVNDTPVVEDLALAATEDGDPLTELFPGDDIDSDDDQTTLVYTIVEFPAEGLLTNNDDGSFTFDVLPGEAFQDLALGETRDVFFVYTATDRHGAVSDPATVTITVTGVNDTPVVQDMLVSAEEDGPPVTFTYAADDVDSDDDVTTLTYTFLNIPFEGTIQDNGDGTFTFDPGPEFQDLGLGEFRDMLIVYTATDRHGATSEEATITVRVDGVNDPPVAVDDPTLQSGYSTPRGQVLSISNPNNGLLFNDFDPDANDVIVVQDAPVTVISTEGATVVIFEDGTFTYDPRTSDSLQQLPLGTNVFDTFPYTIVDNHGATDSATVSIFVTGENSPPVANPILVFAVEDGPSVTNPFLGDDPDGDDDQSTLTYEIIPGTGPSEGAVFNNFDGTFTFSPRDDFQDLRPIESRDVFVQYRAIDRHGAVSNIGTITIRVQGVNDPPVAVDDLGLLNERNTSLVIDVLANDFDFDGSPFDLSSVEVVDPPANGTASPNPDGTITYTPNTDFSGVDTFTYRFRDDEGPDSLWSNVATVSVTTTAFPIAGSTSVQVLQNTSVEVDIMSLSSDADGTVIPSSITIVSGPTNGSVTIDPVEGTLTYTPDTGFLGSDEIQYTVQDNLGAVSAPGTISISVLDNVTPYRNPDNPLDVNADGRVNAFDVLLIVAFLQEHGSGAPFGPAPPYLDVAAPDNFVSPFDALVIVSFLNSQQGSGEGDDGEGEGEGESHGETLFAAPMATPTDLVGSLSNESISPRNLLVEESQRTSSVRLSMSDSVTVVKRTSTEEEFVAPVPTRESLTSSQGQGASQGGGVSRSTDALDDELFDELARSVESARGESLADRALMSLLYDSDYAVKRNGRNG